MAENRLVGSLVLRTFDIFETTKTAPLTGVNATEFTIYGRASANGCVITWYNVNIRQCIGSELYNKHNKFNLKMTSAQTRHNATTAVTDAQFIVYMSGLPFSNGSCYNTRNGVTNQCALGCVNFTASVSAGTTTAFSSGLVTFDKPLNDLVDITIELKNSSNNIANGLNEKTTMVLGHWSIVCDIYGVEK